jgi:hypothetical protein
MDLKSAVERARKFYAQEKRSAANVTVAASHWGYGATSSGGRQVIAALISYGLLQDEGSGEHRQVRLTDLALRIVLDDRPDSRERDEALRQAALTPKINAELLSKWPRLEVSDANLKHYLVLGRKFNENNVADFIRDLRTTVEFAKLLDKPQNENDAALPPRADLEVPKIGDWVRWESGGAIRFERRRMVWLSEDGTHARVEGSQTGLPVSELTVVDAPVETPLGASPMNAPVQPQHREVQTPPPPPLDVAPGFLDETYPLDHGRSFILRRPVNISSDELSEFEDWIKLVQKKLKRSLPPAHQ